MKYYKVVWNKNGQLVSVCRNSYFPSGLRVEYKIGEWAKPILQGSKLFIFNSLACARRFSRTMSDSEIYECEIQGHIGSPKYLACISLMRYFWRDKQRRRRITRLYIQQQIPKGTRTASAVKLVEKVS